MHGAFTAADADAAGRTLAAYGFGLLPFVLIRSTVATFFARGDTATPVKAALIAAAVNIAFKILLMGPLAQVGLALATSIGAWINLGLVVWFAHRAGHDRIDERLRQSTLKLAAAGLAHGGGAVVRPGAARARVRRLASLAGSGDAARAGNRCQRHLWCHRYCACLAPPGWRNFAPGRAALKRSFITLLPSCEGGHSSAATLWGRAGFCVVEPTPQGFMNATRAIPSFSLMRGARVVRCARLRLWSQPAGRASSRPARRRRRR